MRRHCLFLVIFFDITFSQTPLPVVVQDLNSFVSMAVEREPRFGEKKLPVEKARFQKTALLNSAVLPKFEIGGALGPAPAYTVIKNTAGESNEQYDFRNIGPFVGMEFKALQPLNFRRLRSGLHAANCNIDLARYEVKKNEVEMNENLQEIYYQYLFSRQMACLAADVKNKLENAIRKIDSLVNDDAPNIAQSDLFELKTYLFKVDDGLYKARYGLAATTSAMAFSLEADSVIVTDTLLALRGERIAPIDSMKLLLQANHPDLKRLSSGLEAQEALVNEAHSELFPDFFIAGSYTYRKSWNRRKGDPDNIENLLDPYNKTSGTLGIGLRYDVNVWSKMDKYRKAKLELETVRQKETYALKGLTRDMENQFTKVRMHKERQESAAASMRASDSWLKAMAMKYDLDPTQIKGLLKAYEANIQAVRDYYECILDYDIAVAGLISKLGLTLNEYQELPVFHFSTGSDTR